MTTQDWILHTEYDVQRRIREYDIDLVDVVVDNIGDEYQVEILDEEIPNTEFVKLTELMRKEYKAELETIKPSYRGVIIVFSIREGTHKEDDPQ